MHILGDLDPQTFLKDYWQKKPLLIRGAIPDFESPIEPAELAGLAMEDDIEARIVMEKGGSKPWELRSGPFSEEDFTSMPESHWTLLVQEANKWIPEVEAMIPLFNFIPYWMFDDVMISYAADQGSVGPHFDHYDVFLFQAYGKRHWQITEQDCVESNYIQGVDLRLMKRFEVEKEWTLEPGDMLYLPPKVAHHGVAQGDCMTFSFGYRSLRTKELFESMADFLGEKLAQNRSMDAIYRDEKDHLHKHPGRIVPEAALIARDMLTKAMNNPEWMSEWFGKYVTQPQGNSMDDLFDDGLSRESFLDAVMSGADIERNPAARIGWTTLLHGEEKRFQAFVNGEMSLVDDLDEQCLIRYLADEYLWETDEIRSNLNSDSAQTRLFALYSQGVLGLAE